MKTSSLYKICERPIIYRLSQILLAPGFKTPFKSIFRSSAGQLVLDVGCGPRPLTLTVDDRGLVTGLDLNFSYVKQYRMFGRIGVAASATILPFRDAIFDECRTSFLLHHLPDSAARLALSEMFRVTKPSGRLVVIDFAKPKRWFHNPMAAVIAKLDRGRFMRTEAELADLLSTVRDGKQRLTTFHYSLFRYKAFLAIGDKASSNTL